ncbi:hypothetical protein, partial [Geobacillus sp. MR]|uniref:hypothetical protein n=1 Tax=Geobacillus sp. MR TaxID=2508875 RepID=UPI001C0F090F
MHPPKPHIPYQTMKNGYRLLTKRMSQKCSHSVRFWDTFLDKKEENRSSFGIIESPQPYQRKDGF